VVAEHLSVEEVAGIKGAFDMMDTSNRGNINLEELRVGLQKLGQQISDADLQILMEAVSIMFSLTQLIILHNPYSLAFPLLKYNHCDNLAPNNIVIRTWTC
jgi:hypothetical protein